MSISKKDAENRFKKFKLEEDGLSYDIFLKLHQGKYFEGISKVNFWLKDNEDDLLIEFECPELIQIILNGNEIDTKGFNSLEFDGYSLILPSRYLKNEMNELEIIYKREYDRDHKGLHSYHLHNEQYIYSQGEPSSINRLFPCFDQPDLKAKFRLTLAYPKKWVAITNEIIAEDQPRLDEVKKYLSEDEIETYNLVRYNQTQKISSYVFAVIVGNFEKVDCLYPYNSIPMSFYCRSNLFDKGKKMAKLFFDATIEGIKFFEEFFGVKYSFIKYDHVVLPDFPYGAMENVGVVTYTEDTIEFDQGKKDPNLRDITEIVRRILHELAHMWFGNLVTMKWWNDLWLNESFADFMSYYGIGKIKDKIDFTLADEWVAFLVRKNYGYVCDLGSNSHPICCDIKYADDAIRFFDGISYAKGGSVLKQLQFLIGEKNFENALKYYLKTFQWNNAELSDFLSCLDKFYNPQEGLNSHKSLIDWQLEWFHTCGFNSCLAVWDPMMQDGTMQILIHQDYVTEKSKTLRNHRVRIGFFDENANVYDIMDVNIENKPITEIKYSGKHVPAAILLNYDDFGFMRVILDKVSCEFFSKNIMKIHKQLTRTLIWKAFFDMEKLELLSADIDFLKLVEESVLIETDEYILDHISRLQNALKNYGYE